jgi:hypothetical protein
MATDTPADIGAPPARQPLLRASGGPVAAPRLTVHGLIALDPARCSGRASSLEGMTR